jgi:hypothetical protein
MASARRTIGEIMFKVIVTVWCLAFVVGAIAIGASTRNSISTPGSTPPANKTTNAESILDVKSRARTVSYDELARNPGNYQGTIVMFNGKVVQALESGQNLTLRIDVNISEPSRKIGSDIVYVDYRKNRPDEPRILEDDKVQFWGKYIGIYSYKAIFGQTIQIPHVVARTVEDHGRYVQPPDRIGGR